MIKISRKQNVVIFDRKTDCCGCGACNNVCPKNAIDMVPDEFGCIYPQIHKDRCVGCLLCIKVCAYQKNNDGHVPKYAFAARAQDIDLLHLSASGGVFAVLCENVIADNGIVFGCAFEYINGCLVPFHKGIESSDDLPKLQGSKYVQSNTKDTFSEVKNALRSKRRVLYSGTPCQIAGLMSFLRQEDCSQLFTIDIICHGVPGNQFFQDYLSSLEKKNRKIISFQFRDKTFGWGLNAKYSYCNKKGKSKSKLLPASLSSYYSYFLNSETYRDSCYSCIYANSNRQGDITIGDYWCIEKEHPDYLVENGGEICVSNGVSCILVNTSQGEELLSQYGEKLLCKESQFAKIARWNGQLTAPSKHTTKRYELIDAYREGGYKEIEKMFRKDLGVRYSARLIKHWFRALLNIFTALR